MKSTKHRTKKPKKPKLSAPFQARYRGQCSHCSHRIDVGARVQFVNDRLVHTACATRAPAPDRHRPKWGAPPPPPFEPAPLPDAVTTGTAREQLLARLKADALPMMGEDAARRLDR